MVYDLTRARFACKAVATVYRGNFKNLAHEGGSKPIIHSWRFFTGSVPKLFASKTGKIEVDSSRVATVANSKNKVHGAPRKLTMGSGKTAGRNSAGRITSYHRGGGAKRLLRKVDIKRNVVSVGIIQRIDYDPNRSSRLALVRWVDDTPPENSVSSLQDERPLSPCLTLEPSATTTTGKFSLSSLCGKEDERRVACFSSLPSAASLMVGIDSKNIPHTPRRIESSCARDVFLTALSSKGKQKKSVSPFIPAIPRIAIAGAKPFFSATQKKHEISGHASNYEVTKWNLNSSYWAHRIKRKAAVSWKRLEIS